MNATEPALDYYWHVHDLAQDCVNQGGISNVLMIQPPGTRGLDLCQGMGATARTDLYDFWEFPQREISGLYLVGHPTFCLVPVALPGWLVH